MTNTNASVCRRCRLPQRVSPEHASDCTWNPRNRYYGDRTDNFSGFELCTQKAPWHLKTECEQVGCKRIAAVR